MKSSYFASLNAVNCIKNIKFTKFARDYTKVITVLYEKKVLKIKCCKIVGKLIKGIIRNVCSFDHVLDPRSIIVALT